MVLLGHQLGYNNILSMYAVLFLLLPGFLWLNAVRPRLLFAFSATLWLAAGCFKMVPYNFLDDGYWFLNPWSWQFLFVIGILCMSHVRRGGSLPRSPWLLGLSVAYLAISAFWVLFSWWNIDLSFGLPAVLTGFDKTFLSLTRLLHVLALAYILATVPVFSRLTRVGSNHPLVRWAHSLAVFILDDPRNGGPGAASRHDRDRIIGTIFVIGGIGLHFRYGLLPRMRRRSPGAALKAA